MGVILDESVRLRILCQRVDIYKSLISFENMNIPYFNTKWITGMLNLNKNEIRMCRIKKLCLNN